MVKDANVHKIVRGDYRAGWDAGSRISLPFTLNPFPVPKPAEGEEEGMKSGVGMRLRLGGTCRLDRTGWFPRGNDTFSSPKLRE